MKNKNYQIKSVEDIALQFIKHNEVFSENYSDTMSTIIDTKIYIKKLIETNKNFLFSQNSEILIPYETPRSTNKNVNKNNNNQQDKLIIFQKLPQKNILDDEVNYLTLESDNNKKERSSLTAELLLNQREFKKIKFTKKLYFPLKYDLVYECLTELYSPMLKNLEDINLFKNLVIDTQSRINFFFTHISVNEVKGTIFSPLKDFIEEEKCCELIEMCLILFILHVILELKIELIDLIEENELIIIYQEIYLVMQKLFDNIMLKILFNENYNNAKANKTNNKLDIKKIKKIVPTNNNISFESLCKNYANSYFKNNNKPKSNIKIINKLNENLETTIRSLNNAVNILFKTIVIIMRQTVTIELPENEDDFFKGVITNSSINKREEINLDENDKNNEISPSSNIINDKNIDQRMQFHDEFIDQFNCFKIMHHFLSNSNNNISTIKTNDNTNTNNNKLISNNDTNINDINKNNNSSLEKKLENVFTSYIELKRLSELYYENFKYLIEKNKVKPPFLPPLDTKKYTYTLVLDLDETLVHYIEEENRAYVQVRPYADYFLSELSKIFELVIFTAAAEDYADIVLNELDKNNLISYKLYRRHTEANNGIFIKDLSKIGRDLDKCCIIDNNKDNFSLQPENGLHISSFLGDQNDNELYILCNELKKIVDYKKKDIRPFIKGIDKSMKKRYMASSITILEK